VSWFDRFPAASITSGPEELSIVTGCCTVSGGKEPTMAHAPQISAVFAKLHGRSR
jgi:hypothetical protein